MDKKKLVFILLGQTVLLKISIIKQIFLSLCLVVSLSACVTQDKAGSAVKSEQPQWFTALSVSGGIAGITQNISIDSTGSVIINDVRIRKSIRKNLNNNELDKLSKLLLESKSLTSEAKVNKFSGKCKDCYHYKLSIRWQNKQQLVVLNDINLRQSAYSQIILYLRAIRKKYY